MSKKSEFVGFRLEEDLHAELAREAKRDGRSVSDVVRRMVCAALTEKKKKDRKKV